MSATSRIPLLADTPTLTELGMPIEACNWYGLLGPARMPASIASRIAAVAADGLRAPEVQEVFRARAALPLTTMPEEARAFIGRDRERWASVVRDLNIRLD